MKPILRKATPKDAQDMAAVKQAAILGLKDKGYPEELLTAWAENLNTRWLGRTLYGKGTAGFLLVYNGLAFGTSLFQGGRVKALYVRPRCWRMGAGGLLLRACESLARQKNLERVGLFAALNSRPFYRGQGYRELKSREQELPGGQLLTGWEMEKNLV